MAGGAPGGIVVVQTTIGDLWRKHRHQAVALWLHWGDAVVQLTFGWVKRGHRHAARGIDPLGGCCDPVRTQFCVAGVQTVRNGLVAIFGGCAVRLTLIVKYSGGTPIRSRLFVVSLLGVVAVVRSR